MNENIIQTNYKVNGMTCTSCSMKIENTLMETAGVIRAEVSYKESTTSVEFDSSIINSDFIGQIINNLGYEAEPKHSSVTITKTPNVSNKKTFKKNNGMAVFLGIVIIGLALYLVFNNTIGVEFLPKVNQSMGYGLLFVIGLMTSVHCIAMCGGINLSQCVTNSISADTPVSGKLKPSLLYNAGRVISYTVIGGIVGAIGSVISFSGAARGIVSIAAGLFMVLMGLNMMNLLPGLRKLIPHMPKKIGKKINETKKGRKPFVVGLLNGFMPCGPLQTMQIYALGTGSFLTGALSMFLFSLGTVPLMFGFGAMSSILSSRFTKKLMIVSAALVMLLGVIMMGRGFSLSGISPVVANDKTGNTAIVDGFSQTVTTEMEPNVYESFIVKAKIPVVWTIIVEEGDLNGCNNPLTIPAYGIEKELIVGENIIEFTPGLENNIVYTCWMGMISGNIKVVDEINETTSPDLRVIGNARENESLVSCCSVDSLTEQSPTINQVAYAEIKYGIQTFNLSVNENGFEPSLLIIEKNIETKWIINGEKLDYCNNKLILSSFDMKIDLEKGENILYFTPTQSFSYSCWMGMIKGYVKVVDDIKNINLAEIKSEAAEYLSASY